MGEDGKEKKSEEKSFGNKFKEIFQVEEESKEENDFNLTHKKSETTKKSQYSKNDNSYKKDDSSEKLPSNLMEIWRAEKEKRSKQGKDPFQKIDGTQKKDSDQNPPIGCVIAALVMFIVIIFLIIKYWQEILTLLLGILIIIVICTIAVLTYRGILYSNMRKKKTSSK